MEINKKEQSIKQLHNLTAYRRNRTKHTSLTHIYMTIHFNKTCRC